jgi:hypothetical protein
MSSEKKLAMPVPYISPSSYTLFMQDPMAWYQQYFVARTDEATPKMTLGKIFQMAWCDPQYDFSDELKKAGFTSREERIIKTALDHPKTIKFPKDKTEIKIQVTGAGLLHPVLCIYDGLDINKKLSVENKFGASWNQQRANEAVQNTWQMLVCKLKYGFVPKQILQSFNSNNGRPAHFPVKKTAADFKELVENINSMVLRVQAGDFTKY